MVLNLQAKRHLQVAGNLDLLGTHGVVSLAYVAEFTGQIRLEINKQTFYLWLRRGNLVYIQGPNTFDLIKQLLLQHKLLTPSIYKRFFKLYRIDFAHQLQQGLSSPQSVGLESAYWLRFLMEKYMFSRQQRDEFVKLITEWQWFYIAALHSGIFASQEVDLPNICFDLIGLPWQRLQNRQQQLLAATASQSENYNWELPCTLHAKVSRLTPVALCVHLLKQQTWTGVFIVENALGRHKLYFRHGEFLANTRTLIECLQSLPKRYHLKRQSHITPPPNVHGLAGDEVVKQLFSDESVQSALHQREMLLERLEPVQFLEVTNFKAKIEIIFERIWLHLRPSLSWFIPLATPLIIALIYIVVVKQRYQQNFNQLNLKPNIYAVANDLLYRLQERRLNFNQDSLELNENQLRIHLTRSIQTNRVNYNIQLDSTNQQGLTLEISAIDLQPAASRGKIILMQMP